MTSEVTRTEFDTLCKVVESLTRRMDLAAKGRQQEAPAQEDSTTGIPRGKYRGMNHDDIVDSDPWYIAWLEDKGLTVAFGFTDDQVGDALERARKPDPRRQKAYR